MDSFLWKSENYGNKNAQDKQSDGESSTIGILSDPLQDAPDKVLDALDHPRSTSYAYFTQRCFVGQGSDCLLV